MCRLPQFEGRPSVRLVTAVTDECGEEDWQPKTRLRLASEGGVRRPAQPNDRDDDGHVRPKGGDVLNIGQVPQKRTMPAIDTRAAATPTGRHQSAGTKAPQKDRAATARPTNDATQKVLAIQANAASAPPCPSPRGISTPDGPIVPADEAAGARLRPRLSRARGIECRESSGPESA